GSAIVLCESGNSNERNSSGCGYDKAHVNPPCLAIGTKTLPTCIAFQRNFVPADHLSFAATELLASRTRCLAATARGDSYAFLFSQDGNRRHGRTDVQGGEQ